MSAGKTSLVRMSAIRSVSQMRNSLRKYNFPLLTSLWLAVEQIREQSTGNPSRPHSGKESLIIRSGRYRMDSTYWKMVVTNKSFLISLSQKLSHRKAVSKR